MPHAVITGGEGDLARALADELRSAGYTVEAPGRDDLDVTDPAQVVGYFSGPRQIDLLVNNAGITRDAAFARLDESSWDAVVETNLTGAWRCSREAVKAMRRSRKPGHILQIGSFAAFRGTAGQAAYASAKAGLIGLTKSLAREVGSRGIRINCVLPGFLETRMTSSLSPEMLEDVRAEHCLGRLGTPAEAARFIAFLDRQLPGVSGQVFHLDSRIGRW